MRIFKQVAFLSLLLSISLFSFSFKSNETLADKILSYFQRIQEEFPVEKAYLHLDKELYTLGEDVWFSAYVVAGSGQIPTPLSGTLYVDLFNGEGILISQKKIKLDNGKGNGDFKLPTFGEEGIYRIKAYTAWMENFGTEFFFEKDIQVFDGASTAFFPQVEFSEMEVSQGKVKYLVNLEAMDKDGKALANQPVHLIAYGDGEALYDRELTLNSAGQISTSFEFPEKPFKAQWLELTYLENGDYPVAKRVKLPYSLTLADVQFLPEGGHLVANRKSQVAFKGIFPDGSPATLTGEIKNSSEPTPIETFFGGMGKFELTPEVGTQYIAQLSDPETGISKDFPLPTVKDHGLVMQVVNNPSSNYVTALVQGDLEDTELILVSQTRGILNYMINGKLTNGMWGIRIPKADLITGINQISVLTQEGEPLLERLIFFQNPTQVKLEVSKTSNISTRGKMNLDIKASLDGEPLAGNYSISIADVGQVGSGQLYNSHILSHLLLTSDLKGAIYQPGYYFKDQEEETLQALDLVMMTNGWRRFTWDDVLASNFPKSEKFIERGINIEGTVIDSDKTKKGLRGGKINAVVGNGIDLISSEFGPNGRFILMEMDYLDTAQITITAEDQRRGKNVDIQIEQPTPLFGQIAGKYPKHLTLPKELLATSQERNFMKQMLEDESIMELEGITVESETMDKEEQRTRKIYGEGDASINPDKILASMAFTNIFQMIQGRVSGVQVVVTGQQASVTIRGVGSVNAGTGPLYLLDNMPVDAGTMMQVNPQDVETIDIFKDPAKAAIFGAQGSNGVIAVYTKRGSGFTDYTVPGKLTTQYGGYASAREFYSPQYETAAPEASFNDKRATLYWNPSLKLGADGKSTLTYFNSDIAQKHLVVIEGMDENGRLARYEAILE